MIFAENEEIKPVASDVFKRFDFMHWRIFCHKRAYYQIITLELLEFLKPLIAGKKAIEIGAGLGVLGKALDIPCTDSRLQEWNAEVRQLYKSMGQPLIVYPEHVEKLTSVEAVEKYTPDVVIGCYITQFGTPAVRNSSPYGVDEIELMKNIQTYIHIGADNVHTFKLIDSCKDVQYKYDVRADWLANRAPDGRFIKIYSHVPVDFTNSPVKFSYVNF